MIFDERIFIRNEMLRGDVIYDLSFRFRDINLDNVNDIYLAISIIIIIATTLFEALIIAAFVFKFDIVIIFDVDDIAAIIIVVFKRSIFKFIVFDFDMKDYFIMSASFDKS